MKYRVEVSNTIEEIPARLFIENIEKMQYRCESEISILFVIKGAVQIGQDNKRFTLREEGILLINPNSLYTIEGLNANQIAVLQIDGEYFDNSYSDFCKLIFKLNSSDYEESKSEDYIHLKNTLVKLLDSLIMKRSGYLLRAKQLTIEVIFCLIHKFADNISKEILIKNQEKERINTVIEYIFSHYKEKISLKDIAKYLNLNPQYISRYFSKHMGVTLSSFISSIRLQESIKPLCSSDKKITYISLEYGFPNFKSYFKAFKDTYGMTPSKYKSIYLSEIKKNNIVLDLSKYNISDATNYIDDEYLSLPQVRETHIINCNTHGEPLNKTWMRIMAFGRASEGMREELRNQLRMLQKDIPFEYVRFHGILSDEMMVYSEDSLGNAEYNFTYVDELIDFLLEIKLKPFIELGFMPEQLASEKKYMFLWKANISFPKSVEKWTDLIKNLVIHLIERYGISEVQTWYFEIWNHLCLGKPLNDYFGFIKNTYNAVKEASPILKVGGMIGYLLLDDFRSFAKAQDLTLDFISFGLYSIIPSHDSDLLNLFDKYMKVSENHYIPQNSIKICTYADESFIDRSIDNYISTLSKLQYMVKELYISEWNSSPYPKDLLHDTCFKAAFLVRNILGNYSKVNGMAYWSFSDIFEEIKTSNSTFHGGMGIITNNGIKKPAYFAYQMMNKLGTEILTRGDNFIVTRKQNASIQILAYNYCHFISSDIKCEGNDITTKDRYNVFLEKNSDIEFVLKGLNGKFIEKVYRINKENGSAYDEWLEIGAPAVMSPDEISLIKHKSIYGYKIMEVQINEDFVISEKIQSHEVLLIELSPV